MAGGPRARRWTPRRGPRRSSSGSRSTATGTTEFPIRKGEAVVRLAELARRLLARVRAPTSPGSRRPCGRSRSAGRCRRPRRPAPRAGRSSRPSTSATLTMASAVDWVSLWSCSAIVWNRRSIEPSTSRAEPGLELLHRAQGLPGSASASLAARRHADIRSARTWLSERISFASAADAARPRAPRMPFLGPLLRLHDRLDERRCPSCRSTRSSVQPLERLIERRRDRDVGGLGRSMRHRLGHRPELRLDLLGQLRQVALDRSRSSRASTSDIRSFDDLAQPLLLRSARSDRSARAAPGSPIGSAARAPSPGSPAAVSIATWCSWSSALDPDPLAEHLDLLGDLGGLVGHGRAELLGQRVVVRGERGGVLLRSAARAVPSPRRRPARSPPSPRRSAPSRGDQVAVLDDLVLDRAGEVLVALVEVLRTSPRCAARPARAGCGPGPRPAGWGSPRSRGSSAPRAASPRASARPFSASSLSASSRRAVRTASAWNRSSLDAIRLRIAWSRERKLRIRSCSGRRRCRTSATPRSRSRASARSACSSIVRSPSSSRSSTRAARACRARWRTSSGHVGPAGEQATPGGAGSSGGYVVPVSHDEASRSGAGAMRRAKRRSASGARTRTPSAKTVSCWTAGALFAGLEGHTYTGCSDVPNVPGRPEPRGVAQLGRAPVSKTGGWGFKSLRPCKGAPMNRQMKRTQERARGRKSGTVPERREAAATAAAQVVRSSRRRRSARAPASS